MRDSVSQTEEQAKRMGAPRALALCQNFGGALDFQLGRWDEAEKQLRRAVELYEQVGSASGVALSQQRLGVLLTARGKLDEAQEILNAALVVGERAAMRAHCLTRIHVSLLRNRLAADDLEGVRESLAEGLAAAQRHGHCVTCNALLLPEAVRAELLLGDLKSAEKHAQELAQTAEEFQSLAWKAMAAHARARVEHARDKHEAALASIVEAREAYGSIEQSYEAARCLLLEAHCHQAAGAKEVGAETKKRAEALFSDLGAAGIEG